MTDHVVRLPHPDRREPTVGRCHCGWHVTYSWGEHGAAEGEAIEHVEQEAQAEAVLAGNLSGERVVMPGRSL